jgi:hypothetical protein
MNDLLSSIGKLVDVRTGRFPGKSKIINLVEVLHHFKLDEVL